MTTASQGPLLIFGRNGQVGRELQRLASDAVVLGRDALDLADAPACAIAIEEIAPRAIINAAAYTAVDRAEEEEDLAHAVNALAPLHMAQAARALGIGMVHISTDYVFDGRSDRPYRPDDRCNPLSA